MLSLTIWRHVDCILDYRNETIMICDSFRFAMRSISSMMMMLVFILPVTIWCATNTVATNLNPANLDGLKAQFQTAMKSFSDIASVHYTLAGIKELGVQPPDSYCNEIKKLVDKSNIESIYHATEAARTLSNCKVNQLID